MNVSIIFQAGTALLLFLSLSVASHAADPSSTPVSAAVEQTQPAPVSTASTASSATAPADSAATQADQQASGSDTDEPEGGDATVLADSGAEDASRRGGDRHRHRSGSAGKDDVAGAANALLPRDLSPWGMFMNADWVVKAVMIGLALASLLTWTVLLVKSVELQRAMGRERHLRKRINAVPTLQEARQTLDGGHAAGLLAIEEELQLSVDVLHDQEGIKERIISRLEELTAERGRVMAAGTGILATIGATAPFVGLFGTVWGIMHSFIDISKANTTNLAVVAPGIAEALLATALGLVAAIPAVVIYNHFARRIGLYKSLLADVSAALLRLVSRELSTRTTTPIAGGE